jgi:glycosyltransferase involved in cell wall biosynthesis
LVGINPFNFFFARFFKNFKISIFYAIDFSKNIFRSNFLNFLYDRLTLYSLSKSTFNWSVSKKLIYSRKKYYNINKNKFFVKKDIIVPIGVWEKTFKKKIFKRNNQQLVFVGNLLKKQGLELLINAISVVRKKVKKIKLVIVGDGPEKEKLELLVENLDLKSNVKFTGWIFKPKDMYKIMNKSSMGCATYLKEIISFTQFSDPTKIKDYLSCGLPIIATNTFHNAKELNTRKCLILLNEQKIKILATLITSAIKNKKKLDEMRINCYKYISNFYWDKIFFKALYQSKI